MVKTFSQLAETTEDWNALESHAQFPTLSHEWVAACARHLHGDGRLRIALARRDGKVRAIAPLAVSGRGPLARLQLTGAATLYEPMDFLAVGKEELAEVIAEVHRSRLALRLDRLPADSPTIGLVRELYRPGIVIARPATSCAYLSLTPAWRDPASQLSARRRSDLRRARRRAEAMGPVEATFLAPDAADVDRLLDAAFAVEAQSWRGEHGSALLVDRTRAPFYRDYARRAAGRRLLRIHLHRGHRHPVHDRAGCQRRPCRAVVGRDCDAASLLPEQRTGESVRGIHARRAGAVDADVAHGSAFPGGARPFAGAGRQPIQAVARRSPEGGRAAGAARSQRRSPRHSRSSPTHGEGGVHNTSVISSAVLPRPQPTADPPATSCRSRRVVRR